MKFLIIQPFIALLSFSTLFAQGIKFEQGSWSDIKTKAQKEHKYIFIDLSTSWCGPCRIMEKEVFPTDTVGNFMNSRFISVHYDAEKAFGLVIAKKYVPSAYPTFIILNENAQFINRGTGGRSIKGFIEYMQELTADGPDSYATGISNTMELTYPRFYTDYFEKKKMVDKATILNYMHGQKDWLTEVNWDVLSLYGNYLPEYKEWAIDHAAELKKLFKVFIDIDPVPIIDEKVKSAINLKDQRKFEESIGQLEHIKSSSTSNSIGIKIINYKLQFFSGTKDWDKFFFNLKADTAYKKLNWTHAAVRMLVEKTDDPAILNRGLNFITDSTKAENIADKAMLLYVLNRRSEALSVIDPLIKNPGAKEVRFSLFELVGNMEKQAARVQNETLLTNAIEILNHIDLSDAPLRILKLKLDFYEQTHQWKKMAIAVDSLLTLNDKADSRQINNFAYIIYKNSNDPECLKKAINWSSLTVRRNENAKAFYQYTYALLLYKDHQYKKAITTLEQIIGEAKGKVGNTDEATHLLIKIKNTIRKSNN